MKFIRFLTTMIVIHLLTIGATATAQDIAEFEIRKSAPSSPFIIASEIVQLDDNGRVIPSNQCHDYMSTCPYMNRCGFSAGESSRNVPSQEKPKREIDLSPISFQCFDSGCEYEYQNSAIEVESNLKKITEADHIATRESARRIFDHVFSNASSVRELIEQQFGEGRLENADFKIREFSGSDFAPYLPPSETEGTDPFNFEAAETLGSFAVENKAKTTSAPLVNVATISSLTNSFTELLSINQWLNDPMEALEQQLLDFECKMCGTAAMSLHYNFMAEMERQKIRLKEQGQRKSSFARNSAALLRFLGHQLINTAEQIAPSSAKDNEVHNFDANSNSF